MNQTIRSRRVGLAAILCALVCRLISGGLPEKIAAFVTEPHILPFLIYLETGRDVRFSASEAVFAPHFAESPPVWIPEPPEPVLPVFAGERVELYNTSGKKPDTQTLLAEPLSWDLTADGPAVLILSTHTTESYTKKGEGYKESSPWRTLDENYNMLAIGRRVAEILEENGIGVIRDETLHDYPSYNGSYVHARGAIRELLEAHPTIRLVLDLHRDAAGTGKQQLRTLAQVAGQTAAQLMLVLGTNYDTWQENFALAAKLQAQLERQTPGITRPINLRASRFNQDLCPGALLVEVGAAGNTHTEALLAAEELARAIIALATGTGSP